jgi:hypothetical protein
VKRIPPPFAWGFPYLKMVRARGTVKGQPTGHRILYYPSSGHPTALDGRIRIVNNFSPNNVSSSTGVLAPLLPVMWPKPEAPLLGGPFHSSQAHTVPGFHRYTGYWTMNHHQLCSRSTRPDSHLVPNQFAGVIIHQGIML